MSETTATSIEYVDPCPGMKGDDTITGDCMKCSGTGVVDYGRVTIAVRFRDGVRTDRFCFDCGGSGKYVQKVKNIRAAEHRRVKAARQAAANSAAAKAERDEWAAANEAVARRLSIIATEVNTATDTEPVVRYGDFISSLAAASQYRPLTENQTAAVAQALTEYDARVTAEAEKADAQRYFGTKGEKVVATGTVVTSVTIDTQFGMSRLVVVEGTGEFEGVTFKTFGTGATLWDTERGDVVEVAGTIKDHDEYDGTKQTVLTRTKFKALSAA